MLNPTVKVDLVCGAYLLQFYLELVALLGREYVIGF